MVQKPKLQGIQRRWIVNNLSYIVLVVVLAVVIYSVGMVNYYYNNVRENMIGRAIINARYFNESITNYDTFYQNARRQTLEYAVDRQVERQTLTTDGRVLFSYSGLPAGMMPGTPDIDRAVSENETQNYIGKDPITGERILSVSSPITVGGTQVVGVLRYVTSLKLIDRELVVQSGMVALLGLSIILFLLITNAYFIRSIVTPLREITDITKQITKGGYGVRIEKKYEDEIGELCTSINEMSSEISRAEKMKNEFISSVSHELRTPLTAIIGWGETLTAVGTERQEDVQKGIGIILKETRRLSKMVEELLDFARMESGRFTLLMEEMDLKAELEETLFMYTETFKKQAIVLDYTQNDSDIFVNGDRERLKQVFFNLLDNAVKHGKGGKIEVRAESDKTHATIIIRDYGEGIPEEELPYVKVKFYKGTSKVTGSGIGLAVSDEIVSLHSGTLDVASVYGEGTTVTIRLPLMKTEEAEPVAEEE
ncbi:MAG: HAMP domain-containing histidine kinase [Ruminococcaceae bacterium]|nr:HAMP domain-containing histidine kinase [Oscillospiraceae bacterium]